MIIDKVGAIILNDQGQMLVVKKTVPGRDTFIIPGGRREKGETDEETCRRELREELGVEITKLDYFGMFEEPSAFENAPLKATIYRVNIAGNPAPQSEIVEMAWVDGGSTATGIGLGSVITNHVLPQLINEGSIKPATV